MEIHNSTHLPPIIQLLLKIDIEILMFSQNCDMINYLYLEVSTWL